MEPTAESIAQWVVNSRNPLKEADKVDDNKLYMTVRNDIKSLVSQKCKEQRKICADKAKTKLTPTSIVIDKDSIITAPSPK